MVINTCLFTTSNELTMSDDYIYRRYKELKEAGIKTMNKLKKYLSEHDIKVIQVTDEYHTIFRFIYLGQLFEVSMFHMAAEKNNIPFDSGYIITSTVKTNGQIEITTEIESLTIEFGLSEYTLKFKVRSESERTGFGGSPVDEWYHHRLMSLPNHLKFQL